MDSTFGIVLGASLNEKYARMAEQCARSIRAVASDLPIVLFTDLADYVAPNGVFTDLIRADPPEGHKGWGAGQIIKLRALRGAPFEKAVFLDCDTMVRSARLRDLAEILNDYELALTECQPAESRSRRLIGARAFATGVIALRRTARVQALLKRWQEDFERNLRADPARFAFSDVLAADAPLPAGDRAFLLETDQFALHPLLSPGNNPFEVTYAVLDETWNYRGRESERVADLVVDHSPRIRTAFEMAEPRDPIRAANPWLRDLFATPIFARAIENDRSYLADLAAFLRAHCAKGRGVGSCAELEQERGENVFLIDHPLLGRLKPGLRQSTAAFVRRFSYDAFEPFHDGLNISFFGAACCAEPAGDGMPHVHRTAFVSGLFCADAPEPGVAAEGADPDGAPAAPGAEMTFFSPLAGHQMSAGLLRPKRRTGVPLNPGVLVLFPAYLAHTLGVPPAGQVLAIAFDAVVHR